MGAIDDLLSFRKTLVEMRRDSAARSHEVLSRGDRSELAGQIMSIQGWIESIDRAIEDEKQLEQCQPHIRERGFAD
jgi:hypothetical protein